jgi:Xaa-Pro aminopeptidase
MAVRTSLERWMGVVGDTGLAGWLIADFRWNNPLFARMLSLHSGMLTRRAFLWLPARGHGEPHVVASRVDGYTVSALDTPVSLYAGLDEMVSTLQGLLPRHGDVAMEYVERGVLPTVSRVDAGLVELVRSFGVSVVSSGSLISALEVWDDRQLGLHERAARGVDEARAVALRRCGELLREGERVSERMLAEIIRLYFSDQGLDDSHDPDVAVDAHTADPHYSIGEGEGSEVTRDAVLLMDLVTKVRDAEAAPFADTTWMAYTGATPPRDLVEALDTARAARDAGIRVVDDAARDGRRIAGRDVDRVTRASIASAGFADHVFHRTGHSLGTDHVHGMGTNLDDVEFPDDRPLLVGSGFTIEPGLYWPGRFGVRLEVSAVMLPDGLRITTESQEGLTIVN